VAGAPKGAAAWRADEKVDTAISNRPDPPLLTVARQKYRAGFDAVGPWLALMIGMGGIEAVRVGAWRALRRALVGVLGVDLVHAVLPRT